MRLRKNKIKVILTCPFCTSRKEIVFVQKKGLIKHEVAFNCSECKKLLTVGVNYK